jgi:hypothetical protein
VSTQCALHTTSGAAQPPPAPLELAALLELVLPGTPPVPPELVEAPELEADWVPDELPLVTPLASVAMLAGAVHAPNHRMGIAAARKTGRRAGRSGMSASFPC